MILRDIDKNRIIDIANKTLKTPLQIWAYGSRVTGEAHECSDLDLVICTQNKKSLNIDEFMDFKKKINESNIPFIVQVFDWELLPNPFHHNILANYQVLFSNYFSENSTL